MLKMGEMLTVEIILMPAGGFWGAVGQPTIAVAAPTVLNPNFAATGSGVASAVEEPQAAHGVGLCQPKCCSLVQS